MPLQRIYKSYFILLSLLIVISILPHSFFTLIRQKGVNLFERLNHTIYSNKKNENEIERLKTSQVVLQNQMETVKAILLSDGWMEKQMERLQNKQDSRVLSKKALYLSELLTHEVCALPARVIFREPATWNNHIWINIGNEENKKLGRDIVGKNSPVVIGDKLVGVVEEVQKTQSKVRLITDASLFISVRTIRGEEQNRYLLHYLEVLQSILEMRDDIFSSTKEKEKTRRLFSKIQKAIQCETESQYFAKGQIHGSSYPLWRMPSHILEGVGFQYQYADEENNKMDLRKTDLPLIKQGDLLLTTGFDGIFPKGLIVGSVTLVETLRKEDYAYRIKARAAVENIHEIDFVSVLSPQ